MFYAYPLFKKVNLKSGSLMNFAPLLNTLRAQVCGISPEELEKELKEEQEQIEVLIRKAFEDGTHKFISGNISWPAQRALKEAGCIFTPFLKPAFSMEFGGYIVEVFPKVFTN
jgi:hypothetical protein